MGTSEEKYPVGEFRGVPSVGCLIEFEGQRWLFPGDTRTFDLSRMPDFGPFDLLFAHLWLVRGQALAEDPPLLEKFCRFIVGLQPTKMLIAHLEEFDHPPSNYWDVVHARKVEAWFLQHAPEI